ncbi:EthD family reductase [Psychroserpens burtonensis]|uniref:EthD family reductase n=1 Tax=Psychroserpens burtonensis TaxID=49278 RepID=A0A5C7B8P9_9FLAO|nr:hypothetical protein [Psychroserpens burtonensis]TXE18776.1 EthD family reductase [Psychroserpens burtonensis]
MNLIAMCPQPKEVKKLKAHYTAHIELLYKKTRISVDLKPYAINRFLKGFYETLPFYQTFDSPEALNQAMSSRRTKDVA